MSGWDAGGRGVGEELPQLAVLVHVQPVRVGLKGPEDPGQRPGVVPRDPGVPCTAPEGRMFRVSAPMGRFEASPQASCSPSAQRSTAMRVPSFARTSRTTSEGARPRRLALRTRQSMLRT